MGDDSQGRHPRRWLARLRHPPIGAHRGDVVEFTATVNPSDDDDSFGFYGRPTKARFVERIAPLSEEDPA